MLVIALLIGIYSLAIFFLGLGGFLYPFPVGFITLIFIVLLLISVINKFKIDIPKKEISFYLLLVLMLVNLIGALGPELSFDALWYHLTIPKIYILNHSVYFIPGNLFYYSAMPKLGEMLYIPALMFGNEIIAKLIHFIFGVLICFVVFKISRLYVSKKYALLAVLVFYSNLVIDWLSITAYVDLTRVFFESLSLFYFLKFTKDNKKGNFLASALLLGFAISVKLVSIPSIIIFAILSFMLPKFNFVEKIKGSILFAVVSLVTATPWLIFAFLNTKNPIYPLFSKINGSNFTFQLLSPLNFIETFFKVFIAASDPISPVYLVILPLVVVFHKILYKKSKFLLFYSIISVVVWYFFEQTGGSRFLVAYLPGLSVLTVITLSVIKRKAIEKSLIIIIYFVAVVSIFYRGVANGKYLPVETGIESRQQFLMNNLNFSFGDFYDENQEIQKIVGNNKVLLVGMHNLYYVDFPFTLLEWNTRNFPKFVLVQNSILPQAFNNYKLYYTNTKTHVKLYKL